VQKPTSRMSTVMVWLFLVSLCTLTLNIHIWHQRTLRNLNLFGAVLDGDPRAVQRFLKQGAEVDTQMEVGDLPGFLDFSKQVLRIEPHSRGWYVTPLMTAAMMRDPATVKVLLEAGADVNAWDERGYTPLFWAAWHNAPGSGPTLRLLAAHGANLKAKAKNGTTVWQWVRKDPDAVQALNSALVGK
jgi:hypothetical protein